MRFSALWTGCNGKQPFRHLPEQVAADGHPWNVKRERENFFLADEMLLCSRDHGIAVIIIYALTKVCAVLDSAINRTGVEP